MDIRWTLAYFSFSVLLVLGDARKSSEPATLKQPKVPKTPQSSKLTAANTKQAAQSKTPASTPTSPTAPSTDPQICDLKNNKSEFALPSLQCTLRELPQNVKGNLTNYMTTRGKNETHLLEEICDAIKKRKNPEFMSNYTENDKDMIHDTSTLCRIRHTTKSECEMPNLIK
ncbi:uncharacterized protein LOC120841977 [Ixodes scapularis]|uniref:uncharacterized protein LOC120841977 n=1 Tax=Ixodes scapularis TaxID=6945 RepID=UPI001A9F8206|nr:uncharacterized protein LOC120841977 [Ixodes scapularis]